MSESMLKSDLTEFASALASSAPVPGGGGAAALAGALAAALGSMVGNLTVGKKKYKDNEPRLIEMNAAAETLRADLLRQIDADAEGFEPLSKAYGIPKDEPGRDETLEKCLHMAAAAPMEILRLSCDAVALAEEYARLGSKLMISDAGCAAALGEAAIRAAALNVRVNTRLMKDRDYAETMNQELEERLQKYIPVAKETYSIVEGELA